jgi:hypothetical protein
MNCIIELRKQIKYLGTTDQYKKQHFFKLGDISIRTDYIKKIRGKDEYIYSIKISPLNIKSISFIYKYNKKSIGNTGLATAIFENDKTIIKTLFV